MKHAAEVIDLMAPYPGREFKMIEIVRHVAGGRHPTQREWERLRKGVRRVLDGLQESGSISKGSPEAGNGGYATYCWKPGHQVMANRDANRDNYASTPAPV
jgi:hypothetical protein